MTAVVTPCIDDNTLGSATDLLKQALTGLKKLKRDPDEVPIRHIKEVDKTLISVNDRLFVGDSESVKTLLANLSQKKLSELDQESTLTLSSKDRDILVRWCDAERFNVSVSILAENLRRHIQEQGLIINAGGVGDVKLSSSCFEVDPASQEISEDLSSLANILGSRRLLLSLVRIKKDSDLEGLQSVVERSSDRISIATWSKIINPENRNWTVDQWARRWNRISEVNLSHSLVTDVPEGQRPSELRTFVESISLNFTQARNYSGSTLHHVSYALEEVDNVQWRIRMSVSGQSGLSCFVEEGTPLFSLLFYSLRQFDRPGSEIPAPIKRVSKGTT